MTKHISDMLEAINSNPKSIDEYKDNAGLRFVFEHAFLADKKFILPEGTPPINVDEGNDAMPVNHLLYSSKKLYIYCRADLKPAKREQLFLDLLEGLTSKERDILIAVKDQTLSKLYPNITKHLVASAGFIPAQASPARVIKAAIAKVIPPKRVISDETRAKMSAKAKARLGANGKFAKAVKLPEVTE